MPVGNEIRGLIFIFCCSLACPHPTNPCRDCDKCLQQHAKDLENATKYFLDIAINTDISAGNNQLPSCNSSFSKGDVVKAFHTLFKQLNEIPDVAAAIRDLGETYLKQQENCLEYWKVEDSSIHITYNKENETVQKIFFFKAAERYNCLMQETLKRNVG